MSTLTSYRHLWVSIRRLYHTVFLLHSIISRMKWNACVQATSPTRPWGVKSKANCSPTLWHSQLRRGTDSNHTGWPNGPFNRSACGGKSRPTVSDVRTLRMATKLTGRAQHLLEARENLEARLKMGIGELGAGTAESSWYRPLLLTWSTGISTLTSGSSLTSSASWASLAGAGALYTSPSKGKRQMQNQI